MAINDEKDFLNVDLPKPNASLSEIVQFADSRDAAAKFRKVWGDDYAKNARALWERCVQTFSEDGPVNMDSDELLLCLKYDCAMAPYLSRTESQSLSFYHFLLGHIRKTLEK